MCTMDYMEEYGHTSKANIVMFFKIHLNPTYTLHEESFIMDITRDMTCYCESLIWRPNPRDLSKLKGQWFVFREALLADVIFRSKCLEQTRGDPCREVVVLSDRFPPQSCPAPKRAKNPAKRAKGHAVLSSSIWGQYGSFYQGHPCPAKMSMYNAKVSIVRLPEAMPLLHRIQ